MLHILQVAVVFLLMITALVAAHELGHYLFARLFRMGILEFAIGFGRPKLWTWRRTKSVLDDGSEIETEFNVRAWPLGGFVRILGMEPQEDGSETKIVNGFYSKPAWQRFVVLLAGPVFSVLTGLLVLAPVYYAIGTARATTQIAGLEKGYGAYVAGVRPGDVVTSIDAQRVETGYEARLAVQDKLSGPVRVGLLRGGQPLELLVSPRVDADPSPILGLNGLPEAAEPRRQAHLGVYFAIERIPLSPLGAVNEAVGVTMDSIRGFIGVFTRPKQASKGVQGVVGMIGTTSQAVDAGVAGPFQLAALLSISIGLFNLIPVPPLDGGQMLIAVVEMFRSGRRLSMRLQNTFFTLGFALMVTLFLGVFALDISRMFSAKNEKSPEIATTRELPDGR